jgi:hypothetical protein
MRETIVLVVLPVMLRTADIVQAASVSEIWKEEDMVYFYSSTFIWKNDFYEILQLLQLCGMIKYRKDRKEADTAYFKIIVGIRMKELKKITESLRRTIPHSGFLLNASHVCYCYTHCYIISSVLVYNLVAHAKG